MKILAIDLGDTTGYVFVTSTNDTGEMWLNDHSSFALEHGFNINFGYPDLVVVERPAFTTNRMQNEYSSALEWLDQHFDVVKRVQPTGDNS